MISKIVVGLILGIILGWLNLVVLRLSVQRAVRFQKGNRAVGFILASYGVRYLIIGVVVVLLLKLDEPVVAMVALAVLGAETLLLPLLKRRSSGCSRC